MRRGVSAVRTGVIACGAVLIAGGLTAPLLIPSAGASVAAFDVGPRSLADDTVLGVFSSVGGGVNSFVAALAVGGDDTVYAGGYFTTAGGKAGMNNIAAWSNRDDTWHALGDGISGVVYALAVNGDDSLYAGGEFCTGAGPCGTGAGGVAGTNGIAAWSNADDTWHALGSGMTGGFSPPSVWSLVVQGDDTVFAGGLFTSAGGVSRTENMATWSNADDTWHALGAGVADRVQALALQADETVYAGGAFGDASGVPGTNAIAAWSNTDDTWRALGEGVSHPVNALAAAGDDTLYAGGDFGSAIGVVGTAYVAAWSNVDDTWHALGGGPNNVVTALAFDDTHGLLYTGGAFTTVGTIAASLVSVWDGGIDAWIPLQATGGNGVGGSSVSAFAVDGSIVYLGGIFSQAGGVAGTTNIAKWTWDAPSAQAVPSSGAQGAAIQLRGSGLIGVTGVHVDGTPVSYTRDDSTTISLTLPGGLSAGSHSITVDAVGGRATTSYAVSAPPIPPRPPRVYPPGAPTGVVAVAGDRSASVSWVAPSDSGSYPISNYQVTSAPGGRSCLVSVPALTCEVSGLTNGTAYTLTVRALNGAGWGSDSLPSNAVTPSSPAVKSIQITGSRDASDTRVVRVTGTTTDLIGEQVTPWLRFPGQGSFTAGTGVRTVAADGTFEWSRATGKKVHVYFTHGSVKSNTVVIAAR